MSNNYMVLPSNNLPSNNLPSNNLPSNNLPSNTLPSNILVNDNTSVKKLDNDDNVSGDTNILITCNNNTGKAIYVVFHITMSFIAIYLSWRCNGRFDLLSFLIALLFPYVYIIYILATRGTCSV